MWRVARSQMRFGCGKLGNGDVWLGRSVRRGVRPDFAHAWRTGGQGHGHVGRAAHQLNRSGSPSLLVIRLDGQFHHGRQASIHSSSITTFSYYKPPVDYSESIASPVEASMPSSSCDSPRTLSSILSGEGLYEMEHGGSQLASSTLLAINRCERWRGSRNERGRVCRPSWWFNSIPRLHPSRLR
jgi:hypothetical protein